MSRSFLASSLAVTAALACGSTGRSTEAVVPPSPRTDCQAVTADGGGVTIGSHQPGDPAIPGPATAYQAGGLPVDSRSYMVVAAHPLASQAGCDVLAAGGTAIDAAIAVQAVLGLVEPQSSGLGGGAFLVYYDAQTHQVETYDGRETAPAAATEDYLRFVDATDHTAPQPSARASGRSIGNPGVLRMLELAYKDHGHTPWSQLFDPAIQLASDGVSVGGRLADALALSAPDLARDPEARATYLDGSGQPLRQGQPLRVPAYAQTLQAIAATGADAFYAGPIAQAIVDTIATTQGANGQPITPGLTTLDDLATYQAVRRDPICTTYRGSTLCGVPPPSSGGIAVAQTLTILESFDLGTAAPTAPDLEGGVPALDGVHLVAEAERLAYADRDAYVADPDFVPLPGGSPAALLDRTYLASRAALIHMDHSMGTAPPGSFDRPAGIDLTPEHGTTQITIVDPAGNVVAMTSTVESFFGSFHMSGGVILNNQLTDFSADPADATGTPIANRVAAGKRPRSSMAPTLVFRTASDGSLGDFTMATGSPGGATIIQYVVKTLVGVLDWKLDAQQSAALIDFGAANNPVTNVGGEHPEIHAANQGAADPLVQGLRARGHLVSVAPQSSGVATILRTATGLTGGADPRREGLVLGDAPAGP